MIRAIKILKHKLNLVNAKLTLKEHIGDCEKEELRELRSDLKEAIFIIRLNILNKGG